MTPIAAFCIGALCGVWSIPLAAVALLWAVECWMGHEQVAEARRRHGV